MATISKKELEVAMTLSGSPGPILHFPEAASQSFKRGELVYLASGKVTICSANPTDILGIAQADASGTTDTDVAVAIATDDVVFSGNVSGTNVTAVTNVGESYPIAAASNKWHVDNSTFANARVLVIGLDGRDTVGDTAGRVLFIVMSKYRQLDTTS